MQKTEKKYMFNQCLYTLIQNYSDLHKLSLNFFKAFNFYFFKRMSYQKFQILKKI